MNHHITKTAKEVLWDFLTEIAPLSHILILILGADFSATNVFDLLARSVGYSQHYFTHMKN